MTTGHTFYRPIDEIDLLEFKHLKDGRPVIALLPSGFPTVARYNDFAGCWENTCFGLTGEGITHFSAHDPRPIGECVEKQCWAIEMNKGFDPHDHYLRDDCYVGTTIVRELLKIEVIND